MSDTSIHLRPIEESDLDFLRELGNDPVVRSNVVGWDWPLSLAGQRAWFSSGIESSSTRRFIVENEDAIPIGLTGLWDIDWHNRNAMTALKLGGQKNVRGKGYGLAVMKELMAFAFMDVGLHRLHSTIISTNLPSRELFLRKCGWTLEGTLRQHIWRSGEFQDLIQVGVQRDEYLALFGKAND